MPESERYKRLIEDSGDGYWVVDLKGRLLEVNQVYARMAGYSADELVNRHVSELDAQDDEEAVKARMERLLAQGHDRFESRHRHKKGHLFEVDVAINFIHESNRFLVSFRDISERNMYEQALRESEEKYRRLFENAGDLAYGTDLNGAFTAVSESLLTVTGYGRNELINAPISKILTPENLELARRMTAAKLAAEKQVTRYELEITSKDGRQIPLELVTTLTYRNGVPVGVQGIGRDISERKRFETDLRIAATAFESQESLMITDANSVILRVNNAFCKCTGYTTEEVVGKTPRIFKSGRHDKEFYRAMWDSINRTGSWKGEIWDRRKNGETYPKWLTISAVRGNDGCVTHYVGSHVDITERKAAEEQIRRLAFHDPLTHLPNRQLLLDRLQQSLISTARNGKKGALLFIDLDNFKTLNDTLGHAMGDMLLQQAAERLTSCMREGDTVARIGGDEFVVMLEELSGQAIEAAEQTEVVGEKILAALSQPYHLDNHTFRSSGSIGATLFSGDHQEAEELLKQADIAMYQAKKADRNTLRFFDHKMQDAINARAELEAELHKALEHQQFELHYQIQVDCASRALGAEALIRWNHPTRGLVAPAQFIPLAEETGLILPIGLWVIETACAQLHAWARDEKTRHLVLAVNISARQFHQSDFVAQVRAAVQRNAIDPNLFKLELTESLLLDDTEKTVATMNALKATGVQLSLDDFGTGYSSLQYLKILPLNQIKIDRSFVRDIATDPNDAAIVQTIIAMAGTLGLDVIAEGVETEAQLEFLDLRGCHACQGYLFGKPVSIREFESSLGQSSSATS
ncbi:sensor domain-containing protein [Sideroxydans lithotrophicus]|uniref:Diguanylate cyclase/phosphodiesterase with PAS/PAC sensor(S) n=1 Tax=Sideroxydans lithotrophicus (strain ES-1) TaxID=580332 RepID=D5CTS9_SIDLE|nr:EAL domain-containing protein [Sideroxydans lithotrophicus]ADE12241.1 diguanylate cyclase/phosphodiesterase with PAS/PAC sensor(s) [Sideroxydans lithotrophicus ES-1]